jgi:phage head maturation protease
MATSTLEKKEMRNGEFKAAAEMAEGRLRSVATVFGKVDRSGDVIAYGSIDKKVMARWVEEGWLDISHEWKGTPIGMAADWKLEGEELVLEYQFHATARAEEQRTIISERLAEGKKVSTSIGFKPDYSDGVHWFESGQKMIDWLGENNYDLARFDTKAIKKLGWCRLITKILELFELSVCNVGMHPGARVTESKTIDFSAGDDLGLPLVEHLNFALGAVKRAMGVAEMRASEGQKLGSEARSLLESIGEAVSKLPPVGKSAMTNEDQKALDELAIFSIEQPC